MSVKNQVQLITYPDSLGGNLKTLNNILWQHFSDIFKGGVHILPPFPSSGDRGFAPCTYLEIEPAFGTWEDIRSISKNFNVLLDLMVNHISRQSMYFQDFLRKGRASEYADLFITLDKMWPDGVPVAADIEKMFLRRPQPYSSYLIEETGKIERVWTTFGRQNPSEQIDLDVRSEKTRKLLADFFANFCEHGVTMVRLDAVGYVTKKLGTSCFFVEPEIFEFLDWISELATSYGIKLLPEVHDPYSTKFKLAEHGFWSYDFILPYTILETIVTKSSQRLCNYLRVSPHKQFTMLDCHDGIPVKPDMDNLVTTNEARKLVDICVQRGANLSLIVSDKHKDKDGFDVHQIRGTYYSMLDCNDDAYLAARAIQFFAPGIPQVYYVGLLAGKNDLEAVERLGEGRAINRHNYSLQEVEQDLQREVVQRQLRLIRFRNEYSAFNGKFEVLASDENEVRLAWQLDERRCTLHINLATYQSVIEYINNDGECVTYLV
jgi:sucrose phosphorylase